MADCRKFFKYEEGKNYEKSATFLADKITKNLSQIREAQSVKREIKDGIGVYRVNKARYQEAYKTLKELERLLSIVTAQRIKKIVRENGVMLIKNITLVRMLA